MQHEDTIEIRGVSVMRQTDGALLCRMGNQPGWIAPTQRQPRSYRRVRGRCMEPGLA